MNIKSVSLVCAQMLMIWLLITPVSVFLTARGPLAIAGYALIGVGLGLILWASSSLSRKNLSVMPEPVHNGELIEQGPYQYIRHPMYTALIICGVGAVVAHSDPLKVIYLFLLIVVLWVKLKREERLLCAAYSGYSQYITRTSALVPYLI